MPRCFMLCSENLHCTGVCGLAMLILNAAEFAHQWSVVCQKIEPRPICSISVKLMVE